MFRSCLNVNVDDDDACATATTIYNSIIHPSKTFFFLLFPFVILCFYVVVWLIVRVYISSMKIWYISQYIDRKCYIFAIFKLSRGDECCFFSLVFFFVFCSVFPFVVVLNIQHECKSNGYFNHS